jgi:hypothetical protein
VNERYDAAKEIAQLREKGLPRFSGSEFLRDKKLAFQPMSAIIIQVCFDTQRMQGLSIEKTLVGMAIALAEALDNSENMVLNYINRSLPAPMMICPDCPNKQNILSQLRRAGEASGDEVVVTEVVK